MSIGHFRRRIRPCQERVRYGYRSALRAPPGQRICFDKATAPFRDDKIRRADRREEKRMPTGVNRQILLVEKPWASSGPSTSAWLKRGAGTQGRRSACARELHLLRRRQSRLDARRDLSRGIGDQRRHGRRRHCRGCRVEGAGFRRGDLIFADTGWQDYAASPGKHLSKFLASNR